MEIMLTCVGLRRVQKDKPIEVHFEIATSEVGRVALSPLWLYVIDDNPLWVPGRNYLLKLEEVPK